MQDFSGKVVVVTGAARGQGLEEAKELAACGATVIATDVIEPDCSLPQNITFRHLDVSEPQDWQSLADWLSNTHKRVFGLVNNAGIVGPRGSAGRLEHIDLEDWNVLFRINATGPFLGIKTLSKLMTDGGSIVNIASVAALTGHFAVGYSVSKWALRGLSQVAAMELGPRKIRVNAIMPGYIQTPMQNTAPEQFIDAWRSLIPLGVLGAPKDISKMVRYLLSDDAAWVSGAEITIDGGAMSHSGLKVISEAMAASCGG